MTDLLLLALGASLVNAHLLTGVPRLCPLTGLVGRFDATVALVLTTLMLAAFAGPFAYALAPAMPATSSGPALVPALLVVAGALAIDGWLRVRRPVVHGRLGALVPMAAINATLLLLALLPTLAGRGPLDALAASLPVAAMYALAPVCLAGMQVRLAAADAPAAFRGLPIAFVTAGLVALALAGLGGVLGR